MLKDWISRRARGDAARAEAARSPSASGALPDRPRESRAVRGGVCRAAALRMSAERARVGGAQEEECGRRCEDSYLGAWTDGRCVG